MTEAEVPPPGEAEEASPAGAMGEGRFAEPPEAPPKPKALDEGPDPDAWIVTFSDLLTLLMTFFVLMFASADPVKEKIQEAFGQTSGVFGLYRRSFLQDVTVVPRRNINQDRLQVFLADIGAVDIDVTRDDRGLVVTLPTDAYFRPGSASIDEKARKRVAALAEYLQYSRHKIRVEGHTDNREYSSATYPSAWELSLARAHTMLLELVDKGIPQDRVSVTGYGPSHPRFDNFSRLGRARNRRVEIIILGGLESP